MTINLGSNLHVVTVNILILFDTVVVLQYELRFSVLSLYIYSAPNFPSSPNRKSSCEASSDVTISMITLSNGTFFLVTGPLWREITGYWWNPLTKAGDAELWFFLTRAWSNGWANNRNTGCLRRYRAHYGVTVLSHAYKICCYWGKLTIVQTPAE